jgi:uncharacterized iron-regulated membrane protein
MIKRMRELHTWGGLVFGWLLFAIFLTGTLAVFEAELTHWMQPSLRAGQATPQQAVAVADQNLRQYALQADTWMIRPPKGREPTLEIIWKNGKATSEKYFDPSTGTELQERETEGGHFFAKFHYELHSGKAGLWLVSITSVVLLALLVSGIIIRKQVFRDFFLLRWRKTWVDAHTLTGVFTLPFVILITYTGLVITFFTLMPVASQLLYGDRWPGARAVVSQNFDRPRSNQPGELLPLTQLLPLAEEQLGKGSIAFIRINNPGDSQATVTFYKSIEGQIAAISDHANFDGATGELLGCQTKWNPYVYFYRTLVGLHVVRFGGYIMSWLYFSLGLISCAMIAAGLIFFTVKRRNRYARSSQTAQYFYRAAEALNVGSIAGLITACAAFLWSNRLLPVIMENRSSAEMAVFFSVWLIMLLHAFLRPPLRAWSEQLGLAAALCAGLPVINALTTSVGLLPSITSGDWMTVGVDATALVLGLLFAFTAWRVACKEKETIQPANQSSPSFATGGLK